MKTPALVICFFDVHKHKRVLRQIEWLKARHEVWVAGFLSSGSIPGVHCLEIQPSFRNLGFWKKALAAAEILAGRADLAYPVLYDFQNALQELRKIRFKLIVAHDFKPLPLVSQLPGAPGNVLIEAHEFFYDMGTESKVIHEFNGQLLERYLTRFEHYMTVSYGIAEEYQKRIGKTFDVITSADEFVELSPTPVDPKRIRLIHHGLAHRSRQQELLIQMMDLLDERFELDLMLTAPYDGGARYLEELQELCRTRKRARIIPPVEPSQIVPFINSYDIGIAAWPPHCINHRFMLPNKFFEFVQGRLMVAIGPSPEMERFVRKFDLGIIAEDFKIETMAKHLNGLTHEQVHAYKERSHLHARELSSETERAKFDRIVERILSRRSGAD